MRVASEMRRRDPTRGHLRCEELLGRIPHDGQDAEAQLIEHEARRALDEALSGMPDDLRHVLVLVELEGLTLAELADVLGVPVGTAASRLRRARESFAQSARRVRARLGGAR
jgi:RNA polymerase sigma-70 factor (ECF subfamily)